MTNRLLQALEQIKKTVAPSSEAVTIANKDGYLLHVNPALEKIYRKETQNFIGRHPQAVFLKGFSEELSTEIFRATEEKGEWEGVVLNKDSEGNRLPIYLKTQALVQDDGQVWATIGYARPFPAETPFDLTAKQAEIFKALGEGKVPKEIAGQLGISLTTFNGHVQAILHKIQKETGHTVPSPKELQLVATRALAVGWKPSLKLNSRIN